MENRAESYITIPAAEVIPICERRLKLHEEERSKEIERIYKSWITDQKQKNQGWWRRLWGTQQEATRETAVQYFEDKWKYRDVYYICPIRHIKRWWYREDDEIISQILTMAKLAMRAPSPHPYRDPTGQPTINLSRSDCATLGI